MESTSSPSPVLIWSPRAVGLFAFFLAFPAGLILAVKNWLALGRRDRILPNVVAFALVSLPIAGVLLFLPERPVRLLVLVFNLTAFAYFRTAILGDLQTFRTPYPDRLVVIRPWYTGLGWAVLGLLPFLLLVALVAVVLTFAGIEVSD